MKFTIAIAILLLILETGCVEVSSKGKLIGTANFIKSVKRVKRYCPCGPYGCPCISDEVGPSYNVEPCDEVCGRIPREQRQCCRAHGYRTGSCYRGRMYCEA